MGSLTLGSMEGDMWKHHRSIIGFALNFENLKAYPPIISEITYFYLNRLNNDQQLDMKYKLALILGETVLQGFFGLSFIDKMYEGEQI